MRMLVCAGGCQATTHKRRKHVCRVQTAMLSCTRLTALMCPPRKIAREQLGTSQREWFRQARAGHAQRTCARCHGERVTAQVPERFSTRIMGEAGANDA